MILNIHKDDSFNVETSSVQCVHKYISSQYTLITVNISENDKLSNY